MKIKCAEVNVASYLEGLFSNFETCGENIADSLLGSKKSRLGPRPCQEHFDYLQSLVARYVSSGQPIEIMTRWGAAKGYGVCEYVGAELSDILALRRFAAIEKSVRRLYVPGIHIQVIWEDITELALNQQGFLETACLMNGYQEHLSDCIQSLGMSYVEIVPESRLLARNGTDLSCFLSKVRRNTALMLDYWKVAGNEQPEATPEYDALVAAGWKGTIPMVQWEHYISRARSEQPDSKPDDLIRSVCTYLGNALARIQVKMLRYDMPPVALSFVPYPPGTPHQLYRGRVECKVKDSKNSNKTIPPWAGYGVFTGDDCSVIGVQEMMVKQERLRKVRAVVNDVEIDVLVA